MSTEAPFWSNVVKPGLERKGAHLIRVENSVLPGTPDVNGCYKGFEFWIELKTISRWPTRAGSILIPHFTPQQRIWLKKRCAARGSAWLLLRVDATREHFLLYGADAAQLPADATRDRLMTASVLYMPGTFDGDAVLREVARKFM